VKKINFNLRQISNYCFIETASIGSHAHFYALLLQAFEERENTLGQKWLSSAGDNGIMDVG